MIDLIKKLFLLILLIQGSVEGIAQVPEPMTPSRLVNDFADVLSVEEESQLESKLVAYNDSTSTQIAIVIINSLNGYDVVDLAQQIGEQWGVGQAGKNNGIVILVAINDRSAAIATGYGMEGAIPDITTRHIRENHMNPNFRNGDYYAGLDAATTAIMQYAAGEYVAEDGGGDDVLGVSIVIMFLIFMATIRILAAILYSRRKHMGTKKVSFWTAFWLLNSFGGSNRRSGGSGGSSSGGFSGGGSFGGFGGGSFGGGGSGGKW